MNSTIQTDQTAAESLCKCDDCGRHYRSSELRDIADIHQRLTPGGIVPAGECPDCGALAYEVVPDAPNPAFDALVELRRETAAACDYMERDLNESDMDTPENRAMLQRISAAEARADEIIEKG